ncbi:hypothetical protein GCM10010448_45920 [Streptomyces glomeratus]|uniref:Uncharacterized protein n=1 Tax=Streptomyces glomeratus TaxID=284452 RepID=A0ABP6LV10_9ACTN
MNLASGTDVRTIGMLGAERVGTVLARLGEPRRPVRSHRVRQPSIHHGTPPTESIRLDIVGAGAPGSGCSIGSLASAISERGPEQQ